MRLRITVDGRDHEVTVRGTPPDLDVAVDGRPVHVQVGVDGRIATVDVGGRRMRLEFGGGVRVDGAPRTVRVTWLAEEAAAVGGDLIDVRPPMPGRIVRVLVRPGDSVHRGRPLLVLEAMKMQNEVPAPADGVVHEVRGREGDQVSVADVLVRLAPAASGKG